MNSDIRFELDQAWTDNAFGDLNDFDMDTIDSDAEKLLNHWNDQGWEMQASVDDVWNYIMEKMEEESPTDDDIESSIDYVYRRDNILREASALADEPRCLDDLLDRFVDAVVTHLCEHHYVADWQIDRVRADCWRLIDPA